MDYDNFNIRIEKSSQSDGYRMRVSSDSQLELSGSYPLEYSQTDAELRDRIRFVEGLFADRDDVVALGAMLRQRLFPPAVWSYFERSREYAGDMKGLRIRLVIEPDAAEVSQLPWEYCFDNEVRQTFIGLSQKTPIVRVIPTGSRLQELKTPQPKLLVAVASPRNVELAQLYELNVEEELRSVFRRLEQEGFIDVKLMFHATWEDLVGELAQDYDIFQFMGHGKFTQNGAKIALEDSNGNLDVRSHDEIKQLLEGKGLKLSLLTACESTVHDPGNMFTGLGQALVQVDIPAVIGMQLQLKYQVATKFTYQFYRSLTAGLPIEKALISARLLAYGQEKEKISWGIPVLYLQSKDGVIWQRKNARDTVESAQALVQRRQAVRDEPAEARPKKIDNLLEALFTLNFDPQLNSFRAFQSKNRAGALVLSGSDTVDKYGLQWLLRVLLESVGESTEKGVRRAFLRSRAIRGSEEIWAEVARVCGIQHSETEETAQAVVDQLDAHNMVFIVEHGRRVHLETLLSQVWSKILDCLRKAPTNGIGPQSMLLLLIIDEDNLLADDEYEALIHLPEVGPITESAFKTWHRYSRPLLPPLLRRQEVAMEVLKGSENGRNLLPTEGIVGDILENIEELCPGVMYGMRG